MPLMKKVKKSIGEITEILLLLIAFGIVVEILFGDAVPFFGHVAVNLTQLLNDLSKQLLRAQGERQSTLVKLRNSRILHS